MSNLPEITVVPPSPPALNMDAAADNALDSVEHDPARAIYPYSVIPGGVFSTAELAEAVSDDPSVAEHYRDVTVAAMQVQVVDAPREAYMSYRVGDRIFWTTRKLPLREGERVLTDGEVTIRARCGNRLSNVPMTPTSDAEPALHEFERDTAPVAGVLPGLPNSAVVPPMLAGIAPGPAGGAPASDALGIVPFLVGGGLLGGGLPGFVGGSTGVGEPGRDQTPIVFVLPPADDSADSFPPDGQSPPSGDNDDAPVVDVQIPGPGSGHPDHEFGGGSPEVPGPTLPGPEGHGGSGGQLPPAAVVPEPATLTLLGTGVLWAALRRHRDRIKATKR